MSNLSPEAFLRNGSTLPRFYLRTSGASCVDKLPFSNHTNFDESCSRAELEDQSIAYV